MTTDTLTVLVVDDDAAIRRYIHRVLWTAGHRVIAAQDGAEALQIAADEGPFDVLVTDFQMPEMTGDELGRRMRVAQPDLPILYLTGFHPGGAEPDTVDAKRYSWDVARKALVERPPGSLYAVVGGNFANPEAARRVSAQTCLADYSAVSARALGISGSRVVLAAITTRKSLAEAALSKTDNCPASVTRRMVEVNLTAGPAAKN